MEATKRFAEVEDVGLGIKATVDDVTECEPQTVVTLTMTLDQAEELARTLRDVAHRPYVYHIWEMLNEALEQADGRR